MITVELLKEAIAKNPDVQLSTSMMYCRINDKDRCCALGLLTLEEAKSSTIDDNLAQKCWQIADSRYGAGYVDGFWRGFDGRTMAYSSDYQGFLDGQACRKYCISQNLILS